MIPKTLLNLTHMLEKRPAPPPVLPVPPKPTRQARQVILPPDLTAVELAVMPDAKTLTGRILARMKAQPHVWWSAVELAAVLEHDSEKVRKRIYNLYLEQKVTRQEHDGVWRYHLSIA